MVLEARENEGVRIPLLVIRTQYPLIDEKQRHRSQGIRLTAVELVEVEVEEDQAYQEAEGGGGKSDARWVCPTTSHGAGPWGRQAGDVHGHSGE